MGVSAVPSVAPSGPRSRPVTDDVGGLVLVVDDDAELRQVLGEILEHHGFTVVHAGDARAALAAVTSARPDLVVLDLGLPDRSGLDLLRDIEASAGVPVIVLSGRGDEVDRIVGLEFGADDYLVKPVSGRELVAHIRAVMRRGRPARPRTLDFAGLSIDLGSQDVSVAGEPVVLTTKEFELLSFLAGSPRQVFSVDQLLLHVWNVDPSWQDPSTVAEHVYRLRRKLGPAPDGHLWIGTVRNSGYRFQP